VSDDNLVEIKDLDFAYDDRPILKGISMQIPRGKVVAIMGGSGCGKTTLLRLIGGQLKPSRGEVLVDGLSVPKLRA
jgi:phospholipid/cholesterol/gamma-HCH transport system ATP-binding protein